MSYEDLYDIQAIRQLLRGGYTQEELQRVCFDSPALRPVVGEFGVKYSLNEVVDKIVDYCRRRHLFDELLAAVQRLNPVHYADFKPRLRNPDAWAFILYRHDDPDMEVLFAKKQLDLSTGYGPAQPLSAEREIPASYIDFMGDTLRSIACSACGRIIGTLSKWEQPCPTCGSYRFGFLVRP